MSDMPIRFKSCIHIAAVCTAVLALVPGCRWLRGYAEGESAAMASYDTHSLSTTQIGAVRFLLDDFHGLSTDTLESTAVPWKLATTALVLHRHPDEVPTHAHLREILTEFGFTWPERIANWPIDTQPVFDDAPMGLVTGMIQRRLPRIELEAANIGCAGCHAGLLHGADGQITTTAWLGLPNTSLDLDGYAAALVEALASAMNRSQSDFLAALMHLHPATSEAELRTLRRFVWPRLEERVPQLVAAGGALPFRNGGPGRSNGIDALKFRMAAGAPSNDAAAGVSVPVLGGHGLRDSLLVDGLYAVPGTPRDQRRTSDTPVDAASLARIVAFFTTPTMGVDPDRVPDIHPQVTDVSHFLIDAFESPPFPGDIDQQKAARGADIYARHCAQCHGDYREMQNRAVLTSLPNVRVPLSEIGTDSVRIDAVTRELVNAVERSRPGDDIAVVISEGYLAPPLTALWASAPYLHNGSVPTLWHLMHPDERPVRFQTGGHALDLARVGIAGVADDAAGWRYPDGYRPWSKPQWIDTRVSGFGNRGHEKPFDVLTADEKADLLEFLKRL